MPFCLNTDLSDYWKKIYPVGAIYISVVSTSPQTLFGGTWVQIQNRFLLAAGSSYAAGSTGGAAMVTLTGSQIPSHYHMFPGNSMVVTTLNNTAVSQPGVSNGYKRGDSFVDRTAATGSGEAHENMPPYLAVYVWKRTA